MKSEELDRLRAKYWEGKTNLEEERRLKELEKDAYFGSLKPEQSEMDWSFEAFIQQTDDAPKVSHEEGRENLEELKPHLLEVTETGDKKIKSLSPRLISILAMAASLILGFFLIKPMWQGQEPSETNRIAQVDANALDVTLPTSTNANGTEEPAEAIIPVKENKKQVRTIKSHVASYKSNQSDQERLFQTDDRPYVEVNGVKIYDEEEALAITESALQIASSNLRKGMKQIENIKYLHIEI